MLSMLALHDLGLYIWKMLTNRDMIKVFFRFFFMHLTINCVTVGARELNRISYMPLATNNSKHEMQEI